MEACQWAGTARVYSPGETYNAILVWKLPSSQLQAITSSPLFRQAQAKVSGSKRFLIALNGIKVEANNDINITGIGLCKKGHPLEWLLSLRETMPITGRWQITPIVRVLDKNCDVLGFSDGSEHYLGKVPGSYFPGVEQLTLIEVYRVAAREARVNPLTGEPVQGLPGLLAGPGAGGWGEDGDSNPPRPYGGDAKTIPLIVIGILKKWDSRVESEEAISKYERTLRLTLRARDDSVVLLVTDDEGHYYTVEKSLGEIRWWLGEEDENLDPADLPSQITVLTPGVDEDNPAQVLTTANSLGWVISLSRELRQLTGLSSLGSGEPVSAPGKNKKGEGKKSETQVEEGEKEKGSADGKFRFSSPFRKDKRDGSGHPGGNRKQPHQCVQCLRTFNSARDLAIHQKDCNAQEVLDPGAPPPINLENVEETIIAVIDELIAVGQFDWLWLYPLLIPEKDESTLIRVTNGFADAINSKVGRSTSAIYYGLLKLQQPPPFSQGSAIPVSKRITFIERILSLSQTNNTAKQEAGTRILTRLNHLPGVPDHDITHAYFSALGEMAAVGNSISMRRKPFVFNSATFARYMKESHLPGFLDYMLSGSDIQISNPEQPIREIIARMLKNIRQVGALTIEKDFDLFGLVPLLHGQVKEPVSINQLVSLQFPEGYGSLGRTHLYGAVLTLTDSEIPGLRLVLKRWIREAYRDIVDSREDGDSRKYRAYLYLIEYLVMGEAFDLSEKEASDDRPLADILSDALSLASPRSDKPEDAGPKETVESQVESKVEPKVEFQAEPRKKGMEKEGRDIQGSNTVSVADPVNQPMKPKANDVVNPSLNSLSRPDPDSGVNVYPPPSVGYPVIPCSTVAYPPPYSHIPVFPHNPVVTDQTDGSGSMLASHPAPVYSWGFSQGPYHNGQANSRMPMSGLIPQSPAIVYSQGRGLPPLRQSLDDGVITTAHKAPARSKRNGKPALPEFDTLYQNLDIYSAPVPESPANGFGLTMKTLGELKGFYHISPYPIPASQEANIFQLLRLQGTTVGGLTVFLAEQGVSEAIVGKIKKAALMQRMQEKLAGVHQQLIHSALENPWVWHDTLINSGHISGMVANRNVLYWHQASDHIHQYFKDPSYERYKKLLLDLGKKSQFKPEVDKVVSVIWDLRP